MVRANLLNRQRKTKSAVLLVGVLAFGIFSITACNKFIPVDKTSETTAAAVFPSTNETTETTPQRTKPKPTPTPTPVPAQTLTYGTYNGEPLEWMVLDDKDGRKLIITRDAIEMRVYHSTQEDITWENSTLRQWLNEDFYNEAFTEEEQKNIILSQVSADPNPYYDSDPGNATEDKVFLLSVTEAEELFANDNARICSYKGEPCWWWLRSPGNGQQRASMVCLDGTIGKSYGYYVNSTFECVRPAMWIK